MTHAEAFANRFLSAHPDDLAIDRGLHIEWPWPSWVVAGTATAIAGGLVGWPVTAGVGFVVGGVLYYAAEKAMGGAKELSDQELCALLSGKLAKEPAGLSAQRLAEVRTSAIVEKWR